MTVLGGLQCTVLADMAEKTFIVSIPMTVLGGLQLYVLSLIAPFSSCFNTDDGIRRAAISVPSYSETSL